MAPSIQEKNQKKYFPPSLHLWLVYCFIKYTWVCRTRSSPRDIYVTGTTLSKSSFLLTYVMQMRVHYSLSRSSAGSGVHLSPTLTPLSLSLKLSGVCFLWPPNNHRAQGCIPPHDPSLSWGLKIPAKKRKCIDAFLGGLHHTANGLCSS